MNNKAGNKKEKSRKRAEGRKKGFFSSKLYLFSVLFVIFQAIIGVALFRGIKNGLLEQTKTQIALPKADFNEFFPEQYSKTSPNTHNAEEIKGILDPASKKEDEILKKEQKEPVLSAMADVDEVKSEEVFENEGAVTYVDADIKKPLYEFSISLPLAGEILNPFSGDKLVKSKTTGDWRAHEGVDIEAKEGEEIYASADGTVFKVYDDVLFGKSVILAHENGYKTVYSGFGEEIAVKEGDELLKGDLLGILGNTNLIEKEEASHIHFELLKDDKKLNPCDYVK